VRSHSHRERERERERERDSLSVFVEVFTKFELELKISASGNMLLFRADGPGQFGFMEQVFVRWTWTKLRLRPIANNSETSLMSFEGKVT
jgi:hypothetical protein